jgi:DNA-directed RNA polymerase subunit beta
VIAILRRSRQSLDEKVIKYFLSGDIYAREREREGVIVK